MHTFNFIYIGSVTVGIRCGILAYLERERELARELQRKSDWKERERERETVRVKKGRLTGQHILSQWLRRCDPRGWKS